MKIEIEGDREKVSLVEWKLSELLKLCSFGLGIGISSRLEVAVQFKFVWWGVNAAENGIDESPEVIWIFKSWLKETLGLWGKVWVRLISQEFSEDVEILGFVVIKEPLRLNIPELDLM